MVLEAISAAADLVEVAVDTLSEVALDEVGEAVLEPDLLDSSLDTIQTQSLESLQLENQVFEASDVGEVNEVTIHEVENVREQLTEDDKAKIKEETGWSDEIIESIKNIDQYEALKNANLIEAEINGRNCLVKENIDLDYTDKDGITNSDRIKNGLAPIDTETGKPFELHHLGQKTDSPRVELTVEEHRTGEYKDGKKNQSLWHDNTIESEVHSEGNNWRQEREEHWKARSTTITRG